MIKIIKYFFESLFLYLLFLIIKLSGLSLSRKFMSIFFQKLGPMFKSNKIIDKNLNIFSDSISNKRKQEITFGMWSNYGKTFAEYMFLKKFKNENSHIEIDGLDIIKSLKKNKPVIFVSGHFANFEIMSMEIVKHNINLATIYRPLNNFFLNPFMEYLRKKYVCKNQIKKGRYGIKECIQYLNKNYCIALMIDQRLGEGDRIKLFNKEAHTTSLPAQLAFKYDIEIIPVFIKRTIKNIFQIKFYKPLNIINFKNKQDLTLNLNIILEKMIKENPHQWIWTHDRWK